MRLSVSSSAFVAKSGLDIQGEKCDLLLSDWNSPP